MIMKYLINLIFALLIIAYTGCSTPERNKSLIVGTNNEIASQVLVLANTLGYYPKQEVEIKSLSSDLEISKALENGTIDSAIMKLDQAQKIIQKNADIFKIELIMRVPKGMKDISTSAQNIDVLVIRKSIAQKSSPYVATLLAGWNSTLVYINNHPVQTADFLSDHLKINHDMVNSQISSYQWGTDQLNKKFMKLVNN